VITGQIVRLLDDLAAMVIALDADTYASRPLPGISGSVGEHVRHCLDHIASLVTTAGSARLSYDHRERGTNVERDPAEAFRRILRIKAAAERACERSVDEPVFVESLLSDSGDRVGGWSSLGRELAFVASHTVHHQALIAMLLGIQGLSVPERFGYAPSTPKRAV
jgi:hypothetical protein